jgi:hypothetical protein
MLDALRDEDVVVVPLTGDLSYREDEWSSSGFTAAS